MKKTIFLSSLSVAVVLALTAFSYSSNNNTLSNNSFIILSHSGQDTILTGVPADINAILNGYCYDCHSNKGTNDNAKRRLNFDEWNKYNMVKKTEKMSIIYESVDKGKMPPEKFLNKYPEKELNDEQAEAILKWTSRKQMKKKE